MGSLRRTLLYLPEVHFYGKNPGFVSCQRCWCAKLGYPQPPDHGGCVREHGFGVIKNTYFVIRLFGNVS